MKEPYGRELYSFSLSLNGLIIGRLNLYLHCNEGCVIVAHEDCSIKEHHSVSCTVAYMRQLSKWMNICWELATGAT